MTYGIVIKKSFQETANQLSKQLDPIGGEYTFMSEYSSTGNSPATHIISMFKPKPEMLEILSRWAEEYKENATVYVDKTIDEILEVEGLKQCLDLPHEFEI